MQAYYTISQINVGNLKNYCYEDKITKTIFTTIKKIKIWIFSHKKANHFYFFTFKRLKRINQYGKTLLFLPNITFR